LYQSKYSKVSASFYFCMDKKPAQKRWTFWKIFKRSKIDSISTANLNRLKILYVVNEPIKSVYSKRYRNRIFLRFSILCKILGTLVFKMLACFSTIVFHFFDDRRKVQ
jgi:hypothetical protein